MMPLPNRLSPAVLLAIICGCASSDAGKEILDRPGKQVIHPSDPRVQYYFVTEWQAMREAVSEGQRGLYRSSDSGSSWTSLNTQLGFVALYVHPTTEVLYAIVGEEGGARLDEGDVTKGVVQRIVMSRDGREWTDITRGDGNLGPAVVTILVDRLAPNRIALHLSHGGFEPSETKIRWLDDDYTRWERTKPPPGERFEDLFVK